MNQKPSRIDLAPAKSNRLA